MGITEWVTRKLRNQNKAVRHPYIKGLQIKG